MAACGLKAVYDGEDAAVDIVFIHGLRGNMTETWTKDGVLWPAEILPKDVEMSRIFLFGYDTRITHLDQSKVQNTEIHGDADDLCAKLGAERLRTKTEDRPIIFIAHSLGGLVAAQILIHGEQREETSSARAITKHLRGMIFLGTPFRGAGTAKPAEIARQIMGIWGVDTQQHTLRLLGPDSERLDELTRAFPEILNKRRMSRNKADQIDAFFFYETKKTKVGLGRLQVVEPYSAQVPGCGDSAPIADDHSGICRYKTDKDEGYKLVVAAIAKVTMPPKEADTAGQVNHIVNISGNAMVTNLAQQDLHIRDQHFYMGRGPPPRADGGC